MFPYLGVAQAAGAASCELHEEAAELSRLGQQLQRRMQILVWSPHCDAERLWRLKRQGRNGMFEPVQFSSEGAALHGRLYRANGRTPSPCIVMAHGTSATIRMVADDYAAVFHSAGMSVLLYDHRNFGESGGEPRHEINPWIQARGYRDAVAFLRAQPEIDSAKIALWGDSYSAGQVLVAGAFIAGLAAIVAQIPTCGIDLPGIEPSDDTFVALRSIYETDDVSGTAETTIGPLPVVSCDQINSPSLLKPI